ncbi:MAG: response regulator [Candidatus Brocadiales bacterium]|nr:response regulator [Candidatus Brocadiales bacterium]
MDEKLMVLIVDDERDICWALESILRQMGLRPVSVTNAEMALKHLQSIPFKLAFVDVKLPDMDGIKLARLVRKTFPYLPMVLISGYYYRDDPTIQEELGKLFVDFIEKPFDIKEIRRVVQKALPSISIEKIP